MVFLKMIQNKLPKAEGNNKNISFYFVCLVACIIFVP